VTNINIKYKTVSIHLTEEPRIRDRKTLNKIEFWKTVGRTNVGHNGISFYLSKTRGRIVYRIYHTTRQVLSQFDHVFVENVLGIYILRNPEKLNTIQREAMIEVLSSQKTGYIDAPLTLFPRRKSI